MERRTKPASATVGPSVVHGGVAITAPFREDGLEIALYAARVDKILKWSAAVRHGQVRRGPPSPRQLLHRVGGTHHGGRRFATTIKGTPNRSRSASSRPEPCCSIAATPHPRPERPFAAADMFRLSGGAREASCLLRLHARHHTPVHGAAGQRPRIVLGHQRPTRPRHPPHRQHRRRQEKTHA